MKKSKLLLVFALVLIIVVGGYLLLRSLHLNDQKDDGSETGTIIYAADANALEKIVIKGEEDYTLEKGADGIWSCNEHADFSIDQDVIGNAVALLSNIEATETMPKDSSPSDYGFDDPSMQIETVGSGQAKHTIVLGIQNPVTQEYDCMQDDDKTIYLVDGKYHDLFSSGITGFAQVETLPDLASSHVTDLLLELRDDEDMHFHYYIDGTDEVYNYSEFWFYDSPDYGLMPLESVSFGEYVDGITSTEFERPVALATADAMTEYGFDDPIAVVTYEYEKIYDGGHSGQVRILVSDATGDDKMFYGMIEGGEYIYKMGKSNFTRMYVVGLHEYLIPVALPIDLTTIDTVDITTADGKTRTVKYEAVQPDVEGATITEFKYYVNGEEMNEDDAYAWRLMFNILRAEYCDTFRFDLDDFDYDQTPYVTVTVHRNTEKYDTLVLRLYPFDNSFYVADFDGLHIQLFNKNMINNFINQIPVVFHEAV